MTNAEHEETISMLKKIVEASDRTNHAVRGLVRPVLIQLVTSLLLLPLVLYYVFIPSGGLLFLIGLGVVVGGIVALVALVSELSMSKVLHNVKGEVSKQSESFTKKEAATPKATAISPGTCDCSFFERGAFATMLVDETKICVRCRKQMPQKSS
jgi:hypothetical protein